MKSFQSHWWRIGYQMMFQFLGLFFTGAGTRSVPDDAEAGIEPWAPYCHGEYRSTKLPKCKSDTITKVWARITATIILGLNHLQNKKDIQIFIPLIIKIIKKHTYKLGTFCLADEIHDNQMKNKMPKNKIGKCSLWANVVKLNFVSRIYLQSQTHWKTENNNYS